MAKVQKLDLVGARIGNSADTMILTGKGEDGALLDVEFHPDNAETLLMALVTMQGQIARQRTGDNTQKKVLPIEWWQIDPHPAGDGLLFSWRMPGGMEVTFHLPQAACAPFEDVLSTLLGLKTPAVPPASRQ